MTNAAYVAAYDRFRALLKQLLESKRLTQAQLAVRLKVPQSYVSKYETGERRLDFIEAREVCRALGIELAKFAALFESTRKSGLPRAAKTQRRRIA